MSIPAGTVERSTTLLEPLADHIGKLVRVGPALFADDTPIKMQTGGRTGKAQTARMWSYVRDERPWCGQAPPGAWYQFSVDRKGAHPSAHLRGYTGIVHADGFTGFNGLFGEGLATEQACMVYVRRKFVDVFKRDGSTIAGKTIERIARLYAVEKDARYKPPDERVALRQARARPIFDELESWLKSQLPKISGKTKLAEAIRYALGRMPKARAYLENGQLELDNNICERSIRPLILGRKNYLFMGSEGGGKAAAIAYGGFHREAQRLKQTGFRRPCQAQRGTPRPGTGIRRRCCTSRWNSPVMGVTGFLILECSACEHRFCQDAICEKHAEAIYDDTYFFVGGDGYDNYLLEAGLLRAQGRRYGELISRHMPPGRLLDVGCAAGFITAGLADAGWNTTGLEPNDTMAAYARDELGLAVEHGTLEDPPLLDSFDAVCLIQVVGHFHDLQRALTSLSRIVRPGGLCLIEYWHRDSWIAQALGKRWHEYSPPSVLHWFTRGSLDQSLRAYGETLAPRAILGIIVVASGVILISTS